MISETIKDRLSQHPFVPFLIRSSSGQGYVVSSPELVVAMKTKNFVAEARSERAATLSYLHIAAIEEVANGKGRHSAKSRGKRRR